MINQFFTIVHVVTEYAVVLYILSYCILWNILRVKVYTRMSLQDMEHSIPKTRRSLVLITTEPGYGILYMNFGIPKKLANKLFRHTASTGRPTGYRYESGSKMIYYVGHYIRFPEVTVTPYQWFVGKLKSYGLVVWEERR